MPIDTPEDLRAHVALATKVELSTIPPYLYAMYSIKDPQSEAAQLIASVVVEEMLHVCLTTNLLLAIGGEPKFDESVIPTYPGTLAHHIPELRLDLKAFTIDLVQNTFMVIERPEAPGAAPEDDEYETLGQFYAALENALERLAADSNLFSNHQPRRQLSDSSFYVPVRFDAADSGGLLAINDTASAYRALEIIIHQGEGISDERWADPGHRELTHFYKFERIADGTSAAGPIWPALDNPRTADLPERLRDASNLFNALYRLLFFTMEGLFSGSPDQGRLVGHLYSLMSRCLAPVARYLMRQPVADAGNAGPTFEIYRFDGDPWLETERLAQTAAGEHPELAEVAATVTSTVRS